MEGHLSLVGNPIIGRKAYNAAYYQKNRDRIRDRQAQRYAEDPAERKARTDRGRAANPEQYRRQQWVARLRRVYGMTPEDYALMLAEQGGVCAVCREPEVIVKTMPVDHDHDTGVVRGILCTPCNTTLGKMKEDPERLRALADYIEKHRR